MELCADESEAGCSRACPGLSCRRPAWPGRVADSERPGQGGPAPPRGITVPATRASEPESCYDRTGLDGTDSESPGPGGRPSPSLLVTPITGCVGT